MDRTPNGGSEVRKKKVDSSSATLIRIFADNNSCSTFEVKHEFYDCITQGIMDFFLYFILRQKAC